MKEETAPTQTTIKCPDHPDAAIDVVASDSYSGFGDKHLDNSVSYFCAECGKELHDVP